MFALDEVATQYPEIRVWNLSLSAKEPVSQSYISDFALYLDAFQKKYNCLCVVAAGNYEGRPFRKWPPETGLSDGISAPGDSAFALTVGSVAHVDGHVRSGEPSHFSRCGPVSNFIQKPEVVHYGGNAVLNTVPPTVLGVNSISAHCLIHEDIGTSFSTPLVSAIAANLFQQTGERATPQMVKALIVHSALLRQNIDKEERHYYGLGVPDDVEAILNNQPNEITIVLEGQARKSFELSKLPFPIPQCLRTDEGKVRGSFYITLCYDTPVDPQRAFEYCLINVDAKLGKINENNEFKGQIPQDIGGHDYEKDLIKHGGKWAPLKNYSKTFPQGIDIKDWKLVVEVLNREGYEPEDVLIPFALILTIRALDPQAPVYDQMNQLMQQQAWDISNLISDSRIRV